MANGVVWIPLFTAMLLPTTFFITYVWSVANGHVEPDFPYISSTGAYPPESCFFSQSLNVMALLLGITVWLRHNQILDHCSKTITPHWLPCISSVAAWVGYSAAAGISLVGNFQSTNVTSVHMIGASLAFGVGTVYLWLQVVLSWQLVPKVNSQVVAVVRSVAALLSTTMIVTTLTFGYLHAKKTDHVAYWNSMRVWWYEGRNFWGYHITSTVSEWVMAMTFVVFLFSTIPEFKRITLTGAVVEMERDRRQQRHSVPGISSIENLMEDSRL